MSWVYAQAVNAGEGKASPQDSVSVRDSGDTLVLAVSDGAGSASLSHLGAAIASRAFCIAPPRVTVPADGVVESARETVATIADQIRHVAETDGNPIGQYAATLVGCVLGPDYALFVQVGDGIAVFRQGDAYEVAIRPEEAEFINATYFVTDTNVVDHLQVRLVEGAVDEVAILTDGLQPLVLHPADHRPHDRFFETVFRNLRAEKGVDEPASAWLKNMLASDFVTGKTDDDTSIVAARRVDD